MSAQTRLSFRSTSFIILWSIAGLEISSGQITPSTELPPEAQTCIAQVIAMDDSLGAVRNHACEKISLEKTILDYANKMAAISFKGCPEQFSTAFENHRQAWLDLIPFVKKYPDVRGEMHDLFDAFEQGPEAEAFAPLVKSIWDTWYEVENAAK